MAKKGEAPKKVIDRIFPAEYDFYEMLVNQTEQTYNGVRDYYEWLLRGDPTQVDGLIATEERLDEMRYDLQHKLHDAFSTPFDREDIYSIARQMDYIFNYCVLTAKQMRTYGVSSDSNLAEMTRTLTDAMAIMTQAMKYLQNEDPRADDLIAEMRECQRNIEDMYIHATDDLFHTNDVMFIIKRMEVYQNMKETGDHLRSCIDLFHRIIVSIM